MVIEILSVFLFVPAMSKITEIYHTLIQVRKGFVRVMFQEPNGRGDTKWALPENERLKVGGKIYPFTRDPDFLIQFNGFLGTIPTVFADSKNSCLIRLKNTDKGAGPDPQQIDGVVTMGYKRGYLDGLGMIGNLKTWFILLAILGVASIAANYVKLG